MRDTEWIWVCVSNRSIATITRVNRRTKQKKTIQFCDQSPSVHRFRRITFQTTIEAKSVHVRHLLPTSIHTRTRRTACVFSSLILADFIFLFCFVFGFHSLHFSLDSSSSSLSSSSLAQQNRLTREKKNTKSHVWRQTQRARTNCLKPVCIVRAFQFPISFHDK